MVAIALALCAPGCEPAGWGPPNVVVIVVDTLRADRLPVYGYPRPTAPHLERLARESVVFDRAFTVMGHTLPAHVSLVTGVHPATHRVLSNGWVYEGPFETLATRLHAAGYATAAFVSGFPLERRSGFGRGFEVYADNQVDGRRRNKVEGERTNRRVLEWLRAEARRPVFLFVHYYDLHTPFSWPGPEPLPLQMDADFLARSRAQGIPDLAVLDVSHKALAFRGRKLSLLEVSNLYDNLVLRVDGLIEEIRTELERLDLLDHTLLVVTSDHGEGLGQHRYFSHGLYLYEEQLRIPLIVRAPRGAGWKPGRVASTVSLLVIAPTVLEMAGLPAGEPRHGRSLREAVTGAGSGGPRYVVAQRRRFPETAREDRGRRFSASTELHAVRGDGPLKYLRDGDGREELYDLVEDPGELRNLAPERPEAAVELRRLLESRLAELDSGAPVSEPIVDAETRRRLEELGYAP